jgi:hypothetical protein
MFDFNPKTTRSHLPSPPRILALQFLTNSSARLVLVASRIAGQDGTALVHSFKDIVVDGTVDPHFWPLDQLIELLRKPSGRRDVQVEPLIQWLERIQHQIGKSGIGARRLSGAPRHRRGRSAFPRQRGGFGKGESLSESQFTHARRPDRKIVWLHLRKETAPATLA